MTTINNTKSTLNANPIVLTNAQRIDLITAVYDSIFYSVRSGVEYNPFVDEEEVYEVATWIPIHLDVDYDELASLKFNDRRDSVDSPLLALAREIYCEGKSLYEHIMETVNSYIYNNR